ncbi:hypothetical protein GDO81_001351 [Engystomops pustulosus]|uniref:Uncharacterized protein n=1 Tax=Engystomops pustulosus TaxID=76066 RepID=A0AAV7DD75_ENGPU|nr:hypothetical protein GDO81_001351 [Engystomops pustulosus]KAG8594884.1 hypothetical protein GDO81_001351 [Engystomops pustulosus]KAG8594885.1 hypothetical protein GDO81_001351 [Engystomops pustulosus]
MGALIGFLHTSAEALNPRHILWDKTSARHHIITTKLTEGLSSPTLPHQPPSASYTPDLGTGLHHSGPCGRQTALPTASFQDFSIYPSLSPLERKDGDWELGSQFIQIQNSSVYYSADKKSSSTGELNFQKILQWQNLISRQVNGKHLEKNKVIIQQFEETLCHNWQTNTIGLCRHKT